MADDRHGDRLDRLETLVEEQQASIEEQQETIEEQREQIDRLQTNSGPVIISDGGQDNAKVIGHNRDTDGETFGVWGEVDSEEGYGLYSPDDAKIEGDLATSGELRTNADADSSLSYLRFGDQTGTDGPRIFHSENRDEIVVSGAPNIQLELDLQADDRTVQRTAGPWAKAYIEYDEEADDDATVVNGTNINDVRWNSIGYFEVEIEGIGDYDFRDYAVSVTPQTTTSPVPAVRTSFASGTPDSLTVRFIDDRNEDFHLVVHELPDGDRTTGSTGAEIDDDGRLVTSDSDSDDDRDQPSEGEADG